MSRLLLLMRSVLFALVIVVATVIWATACFGFVLLPYRQRYWMVTRWNVFIILAARYICGIRWEVKGLENLPDAPVILLSKHQSAWETIFYCWLMPRPLIFVFKKSLLYIPFFGWACSAVGMIWIDRKNKQKAQQSMLKAGEQIKNGKPIITFPEGTRSKDGKVNLFKRGAFIMAKNCDLDIMPICIINSRPLNPPKKFSFRPAKVKVIFGEPIPVDQYKEVPAEKFAKDVEWKIVLMNQKYK